MPAHDMRAGKHTALLALLATLLLAAPTHATSKSCNRSCLTLQQNCLDAARADLATARPACTGDAGAVRICRRDAKTGFRRAAGACRQARGRCRPCCRLGGVNECA